MVEKYDSQSGAADESIDLVFNDTNITATPISSNLIISYPSSGAMPNSNNDNREFATDQVIVKFRDGVNENKINALCSEFQGCSLKKFDLIGAEVWRIPKGLSVEAALESLEKHKDIVEYAEPDYIIKIETTTPNDTSFTSLWGLNNTGQTGGATDADIDAPEAWDIQTGNPNLVIGVIDTGVDYNHTDLISNIWTNPREIAGDGIDNDANGYIDDIHGWDFAYDDNDPMDVAGHGTHVSGTIAGDGNNSTGVVGVAWDAKIMALKFLNDSGSGYTSDAIDAINYATAMGVKLTNNSWGGGDFSQALSDAIQAAGQAGMLFVAAAGNSGTNNDTSPHYPSSYDLPNVLAVASTDHNDNLSSFSCYGETSVDLAAPGSSIYSTIPGNNYAVYSGTSMATPHVTGAAALVWSEHPDWTATEVKNALVNSVDQLASLDGKVASDGRLNVFNALTYDAGAPVVSISVSPATVMEDGANNLIYTLTRTGSVENGQIVNFSIGGTARAVTSGQDLLDYTVDSSNNFSFDPVSGKGTISFPDGNSSVQLIVDPTSDVLIENRNEKVVVNVEGGTGYIVGAPDSATGAIISEEGLPVFSNNTQVVIPNSGAASPYPSEIIVDGLSGKIGNISVNLSGLSHTFPADVDIMLLGPGGQKVMLMSDAGGSDGIAGINLTFSQGASQSVPVSGQIVAGTYLPTNYGSPDGFPATAPAEPYGTDLSVFTNTTPNGIWKLFVQDDTGGDSGYISGGWSIEFSMINNGTTGNDTFTSSLDNQAFAGLAGNDTYNINHQGIAVIEAASAGTDVVNIGGGQYAYTLPANVEKLNYTGPVDNTHTLNLRLPKWLWYFGNMTSHLAGNDSTVSGGGNYLQGGAGRDLLNGGQGADTMVGGADNDVYVVDNALDIVTESAGQGDNNDLVVTTLSKYTLPVNVEQLFFDSQVAVTATGNASDNWICGTMDAANTINGLDGNDRIGGGNFSDVLQGGAGDDIILTSHYFAASGGLSLTENQPVYINDNLDVGIDSTAVADIADGGQGFDTLYLLKNFAEFTVTRPNATDTLLVDKTTSNSVTLRGIEQVIFSDGAKSIGDIWGNTPTAYDDILTGTCFSDTINGLAGNDTIYGFESDDTLIGGPGNDKMYGGLGGDTYEVDAPGDIIIEEVNDATDTVNVAFATAGTYTLGTNVENAKVTSAASIAVNLTGNELDNWLIGNGAANILTGNDGNDSLDGGAGADKLIGGKGNDWYLVDQVSDVIIEAPGEGRDCVYATASGTYTLGAEVEIGGVSWYPSTEYMSVNITGNNGNNALLGSPGANNLIGGAGDDYIFALTVNGTAADLADGGVGFDSLSVLGEFKDYTFSRTNATDTLLVNVANSERITMRGIEQVYFLDGARNMGAIWGNTPTAYDDFLTGGDDTDTINGLAGNDTIYGFGGSDILIGGLGSDTMYGGYGDDTYEVDVATDVIIEELNAGYDHVNVAYKAAGTYTLGTNVEQASVTAADSIAVNLTGNELGNVLFGNAAANTLTGNGGNDALVGGTGADKLIGGKGDDQYSVDQASDVIIEAPGEGLDTVIINFAAPGTYTLSAEVEVAYMSIGLGANIELSVGIIGNASDNKLCGNNGANNLSGGAGNDYLCPYGVNGTVAEIVDGGMGIDTLRVTGSFENFADYTVTRPNATDTLLVNLKTSERIILKNIEQVEFSDCTKDMGAIWGNTPTAYDDILKGTENGDTINGLAGNDTIYGFGGSDTLIGGLGSDTMYGGSGSDTYEVDVATDVITEGAEAGYYDRVNVAYKTAGTYTLGANVEVAKVTSGASIAVNLTGNELGNYLVGNAAANTLTGNDGNDTLDGGAGADKLIGGRGDDYYVVNQSTDIIIEASNGGFDRVALIFTASGTYTLGAEVEYAGVYDEFDTSTSILDAEVKNFFVNDETYSTYDTQLAVGIIGNASDNILYGSGGVNNLSGGAGNDYLRPYTVNGTVAEIADGGLGFDTLRVMGSFEDFADYTVTRPNATDTLLVNQITSERIILKNIEQVEFSDCTKGMGDIWGNTPTIYDDILTGTDNGDTINGLAGNDTIYGLAGNDIIIGGIGNDKMLGGLGYDTYEVDVAADLVFEEADAGYDTVNVAYKTAGTYTLGINVEEGVVTAANSIAVNLTGNELGNGLIGNGAANTLTGNGGNDVLDGGAGADKLIGGAGQDTLTGGAGNDIFIFNSLSDMWLNDGVGDEITDFVRGQDKIHLSALDANTDTTINEAFSVMLASGSNFTAARQLMFSSGVLYGNTDADAAPEFSIVLTGVTALAMTDIIA